MTFTPGSLKWQYKKAELSSRPAPSFSGDLNEISLTNSELFQLLLSIHLVQTLIRMRWDNPVVG